MSIAMAWVPCADDPAYSEPVVCVRCLTVAEEDAAGAELLEIDPRCEVEIVGDHGRTNRWILK